MPTATEIVHSLQIDDIEVPQRQRGAIEGGGIVELSESIRRNGLIHPIVVRREYPNRVLLVAGERRLRAMQLLWGQGFEVRCGTHNFPEGFAPCNWLGELDPVDALEIEIEENIRREDFTWQERSRAVARLVDLRKQQAIAKGEPAPSEPAILATVAGDPADLRARLLVAPHLGDPQVAAAGTAREALKILERREILAKAAARGAALGPVLKDLHTLIHGDCMEAMLKLPDGQFDVLLTDPPYGMHAQDFADGGGKQFYGGHFYDDSLEDWHELMAELAISTWRICKPAAHAYVFCDIDQFAALREIFAIPGWTVHRTPLIWVNPTANRVPWPEQGPMRKWQMILYAVKGKRPVTKVSPDVLTHSSDPNMGHQAQKPIDLYVDLLRRSATAGDHVIDPFAGTGTIFPAAHELKLIATGIEKDDSAYGLAAQRLAELR